MPKSRQLIFISHATPEDNDFTSWLSARLASYGYETWSDLTQLVGGEVFWEDIEEAIRQHAIKFISVLSPIAAKKRGFKKELSVADAIEGKGELGNFIIPIRIGAVPYDELPILINNKNVIDFTAGWHLGLARLLEKLEKDHTPRKNNVESELSAWAKAFLRIDAELERKDEKTVSNWLSISALPSTIRISYFDLTPKDINPLKQQWPCRLIENRVISFARAEDFDIPMAQSHLKSHSEIETATFIHSGSQLLRQLSYQDRSNIVTDLLRQGWEQHLQGRGMQGFKLANNQICWYIPKTQTKIERTKFVDALGKSGSRALLGESPKLKAFWHFAIEASPSLGRNNRYTMLSHVIFTTDGITPVGDPAQMHRLRRRFCKLWWQDRWRDLSSAYLAKLANGQESISITVAPGRQVLIDAFPNTFIVPVKTLEKVPDSLVDEVVDDADLLYDDKDEDDLYLLEEDEELE